MLHIVEINGINSGMAGFRAVYGDNRVEEKVYSMLQQRYGTLTVNNGSYGIKKFRMEHPIRFAFLKFMLRIPALARWLFESDALKSPKAHTSWLQDTAQKDDKRIWPFETYDGQPSTIINGFNEILPHPLVNPYVNQEITGNKFLQYLLLKDSKVGMHLPQTVLVGLGATDEKGLEESLSSHSLFVVKPILGYQGRGFRVIDRQQASEFRGTRGSLNNIDSVVQATNLEPILKYIEDYIDEDNFSFEPGLSIIQPFIDSRKAINGRELYAVIRAIVCNGQFVDAYMRVSPNPRVNLSQDAEAYPFEADSKFRQFCEMVVGVFEHLCLQYEPNTFRRVLYRFYVDYIGRVPNELRELEESRLRALAMTKFLLGGRKEPIS